MSNELLVGVLAGLGGLVTGAGVTYWATGLYAPPAGRSEGVCGEECAAIHGGGRNSLSARNCSNDFRVAGTAESADDKYDEAMRRMGENDA